MVGSSGTTSATVHRINDLDLKVTSPAGVVYWGNHGLLTGNWSTPGGLPDSIDTVENVFVQNPQAGSWNVTVYAIQINQDGHVETPALDADFALVVTGAAAVRSRTARHGTGQLRGRLPLRERRDEPERRGRVPRHSRAVLHERVGRRPAHVHVLGARVLRRHPRDGQHSTGTTWSSPASARSTSGCSGLNLSDVVVLLDGVSGSSFLDQLANTGPLGSATLGFTIPTLPLGIAGTFQAAVVAPVSAPSAHGGVPAHDQLRASTESPVRQVDSHVRHHAGNVVAVDCDREWGETLVRRLQPARRRS